MIRFTVILLSHTLVHSSSDFSELNQDLQTSCTPLCYLLTCHQPRMCKFALGHVSVDSHHLVTMEGCAWMESAVSHVTAQTRATKASCVRTTSMTAEFPRAPTVLSATTVLRITVAVAMRAMQVCNRYLRSATPFTNCRLFLL